MWQVSGEWNFLIVTDGNFIKWYTLSNIQRIESESPEHVVVWMELDQLLTCAVDRGVLVQVSIKATRIDKIWVEVRCVNKIVVTVVKQ